MSIKNIKELKKVSFNCLTLFSTVFTLASPAADIFLKDYVDYPIKGGTVGIPQQPESILDSLERRIKLLFESDDIKEDDIQRDLKSPPMDEHHQRYPVLNNRRVAKHEKEKPRLAQFRKPLKQENEASNLFSDAKAFYQNAKNLRDMMEVKNQQSNKFGENLFNGAIYGTKAIIDNKVEDTDVKGFLFKLIDQALELSKTIK